MDSLRWLEQGEGTDEASIRNLEKFTRCIFPEDFANFIKSNAGSSNPDRSEFDVITSEGHYWTSNFGAVLDLKEESYSGIYSTIKNLDDQIPPNIVPIIETGDGDYICIDFRDSYEGKITFFAHSKTGNDSLIYIAPNFSEFLKKLKVPKDI